MMHATQRREQASVARGDHRSAARAENVEPIDVLAAPNVVQDEKDALVLEDVTQLDAAFVLGLESAVAAEVFVDAALQVGDRWQRAEADPNDAVGKRFADFAIARERRRQHRFADASHAMHADACCRSRDDNWPIQVGAKSITQYRESFGPRQKVRRQRRNGLRDRG